MKKGGADENILIERIGMAVLLQYWRLFAQGAMRRQSLRRVHSPHHIIGISKPIANDADSGSPCSISS
jgi:hypothetical protein